MDLTPFLVVAGIVGAAVGVYALSRSDERTSKTQKPKAPPKASDRATSRKSKPSELSFGRYGRRTGTAASKPHVINTPRSSKQYHMDRRKEPAHDRIGLTAFHERGFVVMRPSLLKSPKIPERFQSLKSKIDGMGTNVTDGLRKAIDLACETPRGRRRRIILLSDGEANRETHTLWREVERAKANWINIDCIAFGPDAPRDTLERISKATHNGKMIPVNSLRGLSDALAHSTPANARKTGGHKPQTTIYCIDASISMRMPMDGEAGRSRIDVVQECLFRDLVVKQQAFS